MTRMGLTLLAGPANAGKVARLLDRYLDALERDPVLIVPNRSDVEAVERELLTRTRCLFGGSIGTFDDVFERVGEAARPVASEAQQRLVLRRVVSRAELTGFGASARSIGFVDALGDAIRELGAALVGTDDVGEEMGRMYRAYREELQALEVCDRDLLRAEAAERLAGELDAWDGAPVFAYGFEDLTAAEWELLQGLAGRTDVTVSIPYEPGRTAFAWLRETSERLAALATSRRVEELPPRSAEIAHPAIAHVERALFETAGVAAGLSPPPIDGGIRFFEGAGLRGAIELVAEEVADLIRAGSAPERIGIVCPSLERWRAPVATAFPTIGIPYAFEAPVRLPQTAFGHALTGLLRFAWLGGGRGDLFRFLRTPYSGLARSSVDFVEGRLRGRAVAAPARVEEELEELRGASLPPLAALRAAGTPLEGASGLVTSMLRAAYGLERPPSSEEGRDDLRAYEACRRLLRELEDWESATEPLDAEAIVAAFERATVPGARPGESGRVAVTDLLRARTRRFDVVFLLGLEEGSLPRRGQATPFLDDEARERLGERLLRTDPVARDRYLFYTACARPSRRLYLVREAATDEGSPREASPFWEEVAGLFPAEEVARWTRRRSLSQLTWPLEEAPTERERLRALAALTADERERGAAESLARANGWERRLDRARGAFARPTRLRHPLVLEQLRGSSVFSVTELERFADCSSAWFIDRVIEPKTIDAEVDAKLRGLVAHTALRRFFTSLPKELGGDGVPADRVEDAVDLMRRCLDQALEGVRMEMTPMQRRELDRTLWRDLEAFVRDEAASGSPLVPSRFEVSFGTERSAPELQRGLELGHGLRLSGKIDRIDLDPFSARGIVQDYKTGKSAHSAREIERELRLQIPLYMLVLRDLVGIEPLGGLYRPLAGDRRGRGLLRAEAREEALAGYAKSDYLDDESFWRQVDGALETAGELAGRIRGGDVRHDPRWGECPSWCDLWPMCRVRRP
jgi:ATP-dependent helicase/DNAse subunit B